MHGAPLAFVSWDASQLRVDAQEESVMKTQHVIALLGAVLVCACAGAPEPTEALVDTQASLRAAREIGATRIPAAQLHMQLAEEQLQHADKLMRDGENEDAKRLLERAKADADLAVALARNAGAQQDLENVRSSLPKGSRGHSVSMTTLSDSLTPQR
jgi:hypothetical protein